MARRLASFVYVMGEDHQAIWFGPDDTVPKWAAEQITNPKAWVDTDAEDPAPADPPPASTVPPKGGAGSGVEAWAAYAAAHDVDVPAGANRDDIIAACTAAGVPTE